MWLGLIQLACAIDITRIPESGDPPPSRVGASLTYNSGQNTITIIGGNAETGEFFEDIWDYSITNSEWTQLVATTGSIGTYYAVERGYHGGFQLEDQSLVCVFAGRNKFGFLGEPPEARSECTLVYHDDSIYTIGGYVSGYDTAKNDFFRYNLTTFAWENITNSAQTYNQVGTATAGVYNDYLYVFFGGTSVSFSHKVFRVNLSTTDFAWEEVSTEWEPTYFLSGIVFGSTAFVFGEATGILCNAFAIVDLDSSPLKMDSKPCFTSPSARIGHTLNAINGQLYMFGGESNNKKLNDLWRYDPESEQWEIITAYGSVPTARSHHGASSIGGKLVIWGGKGQSELLNDLYMYDVQYNYWEEHVPDSSTRPQARERMCIVANPPLIYIYGGFFTDSIASDLWQYEISAKEYTEVITANTGRAQYSHQCAIDSDGHFYALFGTGINLFPYGSIDSLDLTSKQWTHVYTSPSPISEAAVFLLDRFIVVISGQSFAQFTSNAIRLIDLDTLSEVQVGLLDQTFGAGGFAYLQQYVYLHSGASTLGITYFPQSPTNKFWKIDLRSVCSECQCSKGSYLVGDTCKLCEPGSFGATTNQCELCQAGYYNEYFGSDSTLNCLPCPEGSYNPTAGAAYCVDCPAKTFCPPASAAYTASSETAGFLSDQPRLLSSNSQEVAEVDTLINRVAIGFMVLLIVFSLSIKRIGSVLEKLDLYSSQHAEIDNLIVVRKTRVGGFTSLAFFAIATALSGSLVATYFVDNTVETKSLVPTLILSEEDIEIHSDLRVELTATQYYGPCEAAANQCDATILLSVVDVETEEEWSVQCTQTDEKTCSVSIYIPQASITSTGMLSITFSDIISASNKLVATVTAQSSIYEQTSVVQQVVESPTNQLFRGTPATVFYFGLTPSIFEDTQSGLKQTGYHVQNLGLPVQGNSISSSELIEALAVPVEIYLETDSTSLVTLHRPKYSVELLVLALVGSSTGIFRCMGASMGTLEKWYGNVKEKLRRKKHMEELRERRFRLKLFLNTNKESPVGQTFVHDTLENLAVKSI